MTAIASPPNRPLATLAVPSFRTRVTPRPGPPSPRRARDPFVDAVRAVGTLAVLTVHWLMAEATWTDGVLSIGNALAHGNAWIVTWPLQVLALLFFAAGAATAHDRRTDGRVLDGPRMLAARCARIVWPVAVFGVAWVAALGIGALVGLPGPALRTLAGLAPQPLWFLAVYAVLVALTPILARGTRTRGWRLPVGLGAVVAALEAFRLVTGIVWPSFASVLLAWAIPYVLGIAYTDAVRAGRLPRPRTLVVGGLAALTGAVVLVAVGPYPASLIGMPGARMSNLMPPTMPVVLHGLGIVALAVAARGPVVRWANGRGRVVVDVVARRSMTIYVWHVTAMIVVIAGVLVGLDQALPSAWGTDWWASRPIWFGACALVLAAVCAIVPERAPSVAGIRDRVRKALHERRLRGDRGLGPASERELAVAPLGQDGGEEDLRVDPERGGRRHVPFDVGREFPAQPSTGGGVQLRRPGQELPYGERQAVREAVHVRHRRPRR